MLFNRKLKSSSPSLLFCSFRDAAAVAYAVAYHKAASSNRKDDGDGCSGSHGAARSPFLWLRSIAQEFSLLEIRRKLQSLTARIGRCQIRGHVTASEFGYDTMSYTLNFQDDQGRKSDKESPARNFAVRLPVSPDRLPPTKLPREVVALS